MAWTTFASLGVGPGTTPQLDANLNILSALVPIPCTVSGTNALVLTSIEGAGSVTAYQQNMQFIGIAAATNSSTVTANCAGFGVLNVYKDTINGPAALTGTEIVQNCQFTLTYDLALNGGAGGFHLQTGAAAQLNGQTVTINSLYATSASLTGVFNGVSLNLSGPFAGTSISITGPLTAGNTTLTSASITGFANIGGNASIAGTGSVGGLLSAASVSFAGGDNVVRLTSKLATVTLAQMSPGAISLNTISFSGAQINDNIIVGLPSLTYVSAQNAPAGAIFNAFVSATGTVVLVVAPSSAGTTNATTLTFRLTDIGFAT